MWARGRLPRRVLAEPAGSDVLIVLKTSGTRGSGRSASRRRGNAPASVQRRVHGGRPPSSKGSRCATGCCRRRAWSCNCIELGVRGPGKARGQSFASLSQLALAQVISSQPSRVLDELLDFPHTKYGVASLSVVPPQGPDVALSDMGVGPGAGIEGHGCAGPAVPVPVAVHIARLWKARVVGPRHIVTARCPVLSVMAQLARGASISPHTRRVAGRPPRRDHHGHRWSPDSDRPDKH
jgi:hypothetical protein